MSGCLWFPLLNERSSAVGQVLPAAAIRRRTAPRVFLASIRMFGWIAALAVLGLQQPKARCATPSNRCPLSAT